MLLFFVCVYPERRSSLCLALARLYTRLSGFIQFRAARRTHTTERACVHAAVLILRYAEGGGYAIITHIRSLSLSLSRFRLLLYSGASKLLLPLFCLFIHAPGARLLLTVPPLLFNCSSLYDMYTYIYIHIYIYIFLWAPSFLAASSASVERGTFSQSIAQAPPGESEESEKRASLLLQSNGLSLVEKDDERWLAVVVLVAVVLLLSLGSLRARVCVRTREIHLWLAVLLVVPSSLRRGGIALRVSARKCTLFLSLFVSLSPSRTLGLSVSLARAHTVTRRRVYDALHADGAVAVTTDAAPAQTAAPGCSSR